MKAIMISIKPKWVAKILKGEKTIEIRKTMLKCELPIDVYIYCTKEFDNKFLTKDSPIMCRGKVVAKFTFNKVEEWDNTGLASRSEIMHEELVKNACITFGELFTYVKDVEQYYAWHIDNLEIFDKPKELSEFDVGCPTNKCCKCRYSKFMCGEIACERPQLTKAPQNWCYCEV